MSCLVLCALCCLTVSGVAGKDDGEPLTAGTEKVVLPDSPLRPLVTKYTGTLDTAKNGNGSAYKAAWELKGGKLFLTAFAAKEKGKAVGIEKLEPAAKLPALATWFTGELYYQTGKVKESVLLGLIDVRERTVVLTVEAGVVTKTQELKFPENKAWLTDHGQK